MPFLSPTRGLKCPILIKTSGTWCKYMIELIPIEERGRVCQSKGSFGVFNVVSTKELVHFLDLFIYQLDI